MNLRYTLLALVALAFPWIKVFAEEDPAFVEQVRQDIARLQEEKRERTAPQRKVASCLLAAERLRKSGRASDALPDMESGVDVDAAGSAWMDLKAKVSPGLLAEIRRLGGFVEYSHPGLQAIRALLPVDAIEALAERPDVRSIKPAAQCKTNAGRIDSEGDIAHQANLAREMFGASGRGVKVGVLSDSVDHLARSQSAGELDHVTVMPDESGLGRRNSGEGTAMLEIVHDIVPDAELFFATAFRSDASFAQNIRDLAAAGCSVIIDDVQYFDESPFQDGVIAQAVREVAEQGVLYFSAAGNSGNFDDDTSGTWEGDFSPGRDRGPRTGLLHDFGGGVTANKVSAGGFANLFWADPLGHASDDYDLYVVNSRGHVVRASTDSQDGNSDPYEAVPVHRGEKVVIAKFSGEGRYLYLDTGGAPLAISTPGNIRGHAAVDTPNAFGVAATSVEDLSGPFTGGEDNPVEDFSSDGPRRIFFLPDGTPITPGDFSSTGGKVLAKPDVTAADGVATSVPGFNPFFGTSAAAPHAGAIAALLRSFKPNLNGADLRTALQSTALDIEAAGTDEDSGAGILDALAALQTVAGLPNADPKVTLSTGTAAYTENAPPVVIDAAAEVTDNDNTDFKGGSLTVAITVNQIAGDRLQVLSQGFDAGQIGVVGNNVFLGGQPIAAIVGSLPLVISFGDSPVTPAVAAALMRRIAYDSTSDRPMNLDRTVRFTIADGSGGMDFANRVVEVASVNDAPTFVKGPDLVVRSDSTTQTIPLWATDIAPGPEDESIQDVTFDVSTDNDQVFDTVPSISPKGTLSFRLNPGGSAFATVTVTLMDDGGTANGGSNTSAPQTFRIYRNPINVPPSFTAGPDIVVGLNSGTATFPAWATNISAGTGETQSVDFLVTADQPNLFSAGPSIAPNGTLSFTPAFNASGTATITVRAHDDADDGQDTSPPQVFTISLASFAEEIGSYAGLVTPATGTAREFSRFGLLRATVSRSGTVSAVLVLGGRTYPIKGYVSNDGSIRFGKLQAMTMPLSRPSMSTLTLALSLDTASGADVLRGTISDGMNPFAAVGADRAAFDAKTHPAPQTIARRYTAAFPARSPAQVGIGTAGFPQGDGVGVVNVQPSGAVKLIARLADGSPASFSTAVSKLNTFPLHVQTDRHMGSLSGEVTFRDFPGVSDFDAPDLTWFKPIDLRRNSYAAGWPFGINTDLVGCAFSGGLVLPGIAQSSVNGNALITFSWLGVGSILEKSLNLDPRSRARVVGVDDDRLKVRISRKTGVFGALLHDPAARRRVSGLGVILQKQSLGTGFFIEDGKSGGILLKPKEP